MTDHKMIDYPAIKHFIRDILGCRCPDEVFNNIVFHKESLTMNNLPIDVSISVGGRLLIFIAQVVDLQQIWGDLEPIFQEGKRIRDQQGYNRFRLVVFTDRVTEVQKVLLAKFEGMTEADERLHLHIINSDTVPEFVHDRTRFGGRDAFFNLPPLIDR